MKHFYHYNLLIRSKTLIGASIVMLIGLSSGCKKYLDSKPDIKLAIPSTLKDLELILESYDILNSRYPAIGEIAADNYYLTNSLWEGATEPQRNYYIWQAYDNVGPDWNLPFTTILYSNVILESLEDISNTENDHGRRSNIKGSALFLRALNYFELSQLFCESYNQNTSSQDLGLPLRLNSNSNTVSVRSSVKETYEQIIKDLRESISLLPDTGSVKYHPSKAAAYGLLSRTYFVMQDYVNAGAFADSCLQIYNSLMDYNDSPFINAASNTASVVRWNTEVIFDAKSIPATVFIQSRAKIDSNLFNSYSLQDRRRTVFFRTNSDGSRAFKGNYTGTATSLFKGISTNEIYLIRAECYARAGNKDAALTNLNTLMVTRWKNDGTWAPFYVSTVDSALNLILTERRKELLYRGLRWSDLRRLNQESQFAVELTRIVNGQTYKLTPNSLRYVFLIDREAIRLSGMPQNP